MAFGILEILQRGLSTYCESGIGLFDTQPINTTSNIAILISAFLAYRLVKANRIKNSAIRSLPIITLITGIGSMLWHGAPNLLTAFADTLPISVFVLVSFFFLLDKLLQNIGLAWGILSVFILIEFPFVFGFLPSFNGFIPYLVAFTFGLLIFFGLLRKYQTIASQLIPVIIIFMLALFFRTIDHTICSTFPIGSHFVWHILNASGFYLFTRFLVEMEKMEGQKCQAAKRR